MSHVSAVRVVKEATELLKEATELLDAATERAERASERRRWVAALMGGAPAPRRPSFSDI